MLASSVLVCMIFVLLMLGHDTCTQSHYEKCVLWHEGCTFAVEFRVFVVGKNVSRSFEKKYSASSVQHTRTVYKIADKH